MTPLQWQGLVLAVAILIGLELAAHEYARRHWNSQRGVLWRQGVGHGLILAVATAYCYFLGLPLLPVAALWALSGSVLVFLLAIDRAEVLQFDPWPAITPKGNYTHSGIRHIENAQATVVGAEQELERLKLALDQLVESQERQLLMAQLQLGDLRYMRPHCSVAELRARAEERMGEARVKEEEWRRRRG